MTEPASIHWMLLHLLNSAKVCKEFIPCLQEPYLGPTHIYVSLFRQKACFGFIRGVPGCHSGSFDCEIIRLIWRHFS